MVELPKTCRVNFARGLLKGAIIVSLNLSGAAVAQTLPSATCPAPLPNQPSLPEMVACLQNLQKLAAKVETLETELEPFRKAKGAVIAFDRSGATAAGDETAGYCPPGWVWFEPSGGRVLIGAGQHGNNVDENGILLTRYPSFLELPAEAVGGSEKHTLIPDEMPMHNHSMGIRIKDQGGGKGYEHTRPANGGFNDVTGSAGQGLPHNNMPPYLSLYFCKKNAE